MKEVLDFIMDYRCPRCSFDLKNKLVPTTGVGRTVFRLPPFLGGVIRQQVPRCPSCHTLLKRNLHPLDKWLVRWATVPFIIFLIGVVLESLIVKFVAAAFLGVGVIWVSWHITRPAYKTWMHWQEFDGEI